MSKKQKSELNEKKQRRRRLLSSIGIGMLGAYVAPTFFTVGEAQAQWRRQRSYSHPSYSRYRRSYSYSYSYSAPSYRALQRQRSRIRDYAEDPLLIIEDAITGSRKR
ncbi:hypothetical protein ACBP46_07785 [Paenalcaligenes hominis]|uniref:hypothetical protein n=1 Tax=Paenalcaligenes hominis TaxID=643674 RepID=UPI0035267C77